MLKVIARYGPIRGTVRVHNLVRELQERRTLGTDLGFVRYSFGYYSRELEEALRRLERLGLIRVSKSDDGLEVYEITDKGLEILEILSETWSRERNSPLAP